MADDDDVLREVGRLADEIIARARGVADELTGQGQAALEAADRAAAARAAEASTAVASAPPSPAAEPQAPASAAGPTPPATPSSVEPAALLELGPPTTVVAGAAPATAEPPAIAAVPTPEPAVAAGPAPVAPLPTPEPPVGVAPAETIAGGSEPVTASVPQAPLAAATPIDVTRAAPEAASAPETTVAGTEGQPAAGPSRIGEFIDRATNAVGRLLGTGPERTDVSAGAEPVAGTLEVRPAAAEVAVPTATSTPTSDLVAAGPVPAVEPLVAIPGGATPEAATTPATSAPVSPAIAAVPVSPGGAGQAAAPVVDTTASASEAASASLDEAAEGHRERLAGQLVAQAAELQGGLEDRGREISAGAADAQTGHLAALETARASLAAAAAEHTERLAGFHDEAVRSISESVSSARTAAPGAEEGGAAVAPPIPAVEEAVTAPAAVAAEAPAGGARATVGELLARPGPEPTAPPAEVEAGATPATAIAARPAVGAVEAVRAAEVPEETAPAVGASRDPGREMASGPVTGDAERTETGPSSVATRAGGPLGDLIAALGPGAGRSTAAGLPEGQETSTSASSEGPAGPSVVGPLGGAAGVAAPQSESFVAAPDTSSRAGEVVSALPAGLFGAPPVPEGMDGVERAPASTATPGDADEAAAASEPDQDHAGLAGVEARRRRAERDVMTALGRRLLEERERMGGLGVSIR